MAITTTVHNYSKPHGAQGVGGGGAIYKGSINNTDLPSDLNVTSITASTGYIEDLSGKTLDYNEGTFLYMFSQDGTVNKIRGEELNYNSGYIGSLTADEINAKSITTNDLNAERAWITELNSKNITTEYLTVTKQAHFFELIIDKVRSVGGTLILTQANSIIDYAKAVDSQGHYLTNLDDPSAVAYDVFWLARDKNTGRNVTNDWIVGDQAYCQSFNNVSVGVNYDVSNKYYWRLVKNILDDRYMNIRTGAELQESQAAQASVNTVEINTPRVSYILEGTEYTISDGWNTTAQTIDEIVTGAGWDPQSGGIGYPTIGTMTTTNTVFGIQMKPAANSKLSTAVPEKFILDCSKARLNIGIIYTDDSSEYFPAPEVATDNYEYILKKVKNQTTDEYESTNTQTIKVVIITNADEVEWQLVHGIRLSNDRANNECDETLVNSASIPSIGDNIAQLGYRWAGNNDPNEKSRGNAIIIAAYKTPDNGTGITDDLNQYPIKPPSYAQYVAIASDSAHRFDLAHYRKTYMDANGSKFRGDFYTGGDVSIVDMIQQGEADMYQLFTAYCDSLSESQYILYPNTDWNWAKSSNMPGGRSWQYMGNVSKPITIQQGETAEQAMARIEATLQFSDYKWIGLAAGSGTPGGHWENCYKNTQDAVNPPAPPNVNGVPKRVDQLPYNNWYAEPQTLPNGYYTWMSQAFVNGAGAYQEWQTAVRLTGANGKDGEDGNDIEFIYTRNNGDIDGDPLTPVAPPNGSTYPDDWPATYNQYGQKISDHDTDTYGQVWYDNPQGVSENMKYEYMCQRIKRNNQWTNYTTPVVWSNWGVKGQDGDGYEYIYKHFNSEQTWGNNNNNPAYWPANQNDEYYGPSGYQWSDDPVGVDENLQFEYCATRKKKNGEWETFSTPTVWAHWAAPGTTGPEGPQGPQGIAGASSTGWILVDNGSKAGYDLYLNENNEIVSNFAVSMKFQVARSTGDTPVILTCNEVTQAGLSVYVLMSQSENASTSKTWYRLTPNSNNNTEKTFVYTFSKGNGDWTRKQKLNFCNNNPYFLVALVPSTASTLSTIAAALSNLKYETSIPMLIGTTAQDQSVQRDADNHASYVNLVTNVDDRFDEVTNNINTITSNIDGITTEVTHLATDVDGLNNEINGPRGIQSTIASLGNEISLMVTDIDNIKEEINYGEPVMVSLISNDSAYGNSGVSFSESSFYPVSISLQRNRIDYQHIKVSRWKDSTKFGYAPYYSQNASGFVLNLEWQTIGSGWSNNWDATIDTSKTPNEAPNEPKFIIDYHTKDTVYSDMIPKNYVAGCITQNPCMSMTENTYAWCDEIVYLRGGSRYQIETDFPNTTIKLWPNGYSWTDPQYGSGKTFRAPVISLTNFKVNETDTVKNDGLVQTGIDIKSHTITLRADKVNFTDTTGLIDNKIWIDPTSGTLHAVDGEFSGKITATSGKIGSFTIDNGALKSVKGSPAVTTSLSADDLFFGDLGNSRSNTIGAFGMKLLNPGTDSYTQGITRTRSIKVDVNNDVKTTQSGAEVNKICSCVYTSKTSITLPTDAEIGTMIFVKGQNELTVYAGTNHMIIKCSNADTVSSISIGRRSEMFIKVSSNRWAQFRCCDV